MKLVVSQPLEQCLQCEIKL